MDFIMKNGKILPSSRENKTYIPYGTSYIVIDNTMYDLFNKEDMKIVKNLLSFSKNVFYDFYHAEAIVGYIGNNSRKAFDFFVSEFPEESKKEDIYLAVMGRTCL